MKIVCISDTHGKHEKMTIPDGDILLHAGDISKLGKESEIKDFNDWLATLPHQHKVMIAGNHDFLFEQAPKLAQSLITKAVYLEDSFVEIENLKIWGSPMSPWYHNWAFNRKRGKEIRKYWDLIPEDIDILMTHGPPYGILDKTIHNEQVGCKELLEVVTKIRPKIHLFGHIHEHYGVVENNHTKFINASMLDIKYRNINEAVVLEL